MVTLGKLIDLTGQRFGRYTVLYRYHENDPFNKPLWVCKCDCGNEKVVGGENLRSGQSLSCGCYNREKAAERATKHGGAKAHERLYSIWTNMRKRCNNPKDPAYNYYGGKGVCICDAWSEYMAFKEWALENGYTDNLTIDRIDPDGDYSPENCRWVDMKTQANNKTDNHYVDIGGTVYTIQQWSEIYGIDSRVVNSRINIGWDVVEAIQTPNHQNKRLITYNGITKSIKEWAECIGMNYSTLRGRLNNYNVPFEEAISQPVIKGGHKRRWV